MASTVLLCSYAGVPWRMSRDDEHFEEGEEEKGEEEMMVMMVMTATMMIFKKIFPHFIKNNVFSHTTYLD